MLLPSANTSELPIGMRPPTGTKELPLNEIAAEERQIGSGGNRSQDRAGRNNVTRVECDSLAFGSVP